MVTVRQSGSGGFDVDTTARLDARRPGRRRGRRVPHAGRSRGSPRRLPADITQVHSSQYRERRQLPAGEVLVVGNGQSGAQIAEDLHLAGRKVHLATGGAPRVARFYRGRDCVAWLHDMGNYDVSIADHPGGLGKRENTNHYVTGRDGGRDIDLRAFALAGMRLYGRLLDVVDGTLRFAPTLEPSLDAADAVSESIKDSIDAYIAREGIDAPREERVRAGVASRT